MRDPVQMPDTHSRSAEQGNRVKIPDIGRTATFRSVAVIAERLFARGDARCESGSLELL